MFQPLSTTGSIYFWCWNADWTFLFTQIQCLVQLFICLAFALCLQQRNQCQVWDICVECRWLRWAHLPRRWFHGGDWNTGEGQSCFSVRVVRASSDNTKSAAELSRCKIHWHLLHLNIFLPFHHVPVALVVFWRLQNYTIAGYCTVFTSPESSH